MAAGRLGVGQVDLELRNISNSSSPTLDRESPSTRCGVPVKHALPVVEVRPRLLPGFVGQGVGLGLRDDEQVVGVVVDREVVMVELEVDTKIVGEAAGSFDHHRRVMDRRHFVAGDQHAADERQSFRRLRRDRSRHDDESGGEASVAQPFRAARWPLAGLKACATGGRR